MKDQFQQFADNIRLTETQEEDAKTKYTGVCTKLHNSYYDTKYDGGTKFLFGSYKTKTNVRPLTIKQDVDVLFKIPKETYEKFKDYESNGPSALLQEIRSLLKDHYTTTDKISAWVNVVLVQFANNTHNVEVLPAFEKDDKTFIIPNSADGGRWDKFDPRKQIEDFKTSNLTTNRLTAELTRMIKTWRNTVSTINYSSHDLLNNVMKFLTNNYSTGANHSEYSNVVKDFFQFLKNNCDDTIKTHVQTALDRAIKALNYENENKPKEASEEWRKIFGNDFPLVKNNPPEEKKIRVFTKPSAPYGRGC